MVPATIDEMVFQATKVLNHYKEMVMSGKQKPANIINFNWMARGEPLLNPDIVSRWGELALPLKTLANTVQRDLGVDPETVKVKFNISTIIPRTMLLHFMTWDETPSLKPTIYYSLYSTDDKFRKRWLPKADDVDNALTKLKAFQQYDGKVVLHWAFIKGQNDSEEDVDAIGKLILKYGIQARFNLVRYNPYSCGQGTESLETTLQERFEQIKRYMMVPGSRIVPRVGFDVAASCGMFVEKSVIPIKPMVERFKHGKFEKVDIEGGPVWVKDFPTPEQWEKAMKANKATIDSSTTDQEKGGT